jgi:hypothetical protein
MGSRRRFLSPLVLRILVRSGRGRGASAVRPFASQVSVVNARLMVASIYQHGKVVKAGWL